MLLEALLGFDKSSELGLVDVLHFATIKFSEGSTNLYHANELYIVF